MRLQNKLTKASKENARLRAQVEKLQGHQLHAESASAEASQPRLVQRQGSNDSRPPPKHSGHWQTARGVTKVEGVLSAFGRLPSSIAEDVDSGRATPRAGVLAGEPMVPLDSPQASNSGRRYTDDDDDSD